MEKQVFDVRASAGISRGQSTEHLRNYKVTDPDMKKWGYYDPTRVRLNFEITRGGVVTPVNKNYHIDQRFKDNLKRRGIVDPNEQKRKKGLPENRRTLASIMLYGSRNRMRELAFGNQQVDYKKGADNSHLQRKEDIEKWAKDMYDYVARKYGEDNIIAFVVHLDETNPHVHCTVVPVVDNKISYNKVFGGSKEEARRKFNQCHDEVADINKKWGLQRGDGSTGKHRTTEEYHSDLKRQTNALEEKKNGLETDISVLREQYRRSQIAVKSLTTMVQRKRDEVEALREQLDNLNIETDWTREQRDEELDRLQRLLDKVQRELQEKEQKLQEVIHRSSELRQKLSELEKRTFELRHENYELENRLKNLKEDYTDNLEKSMYTSFGKYFEHIGEGLFGTLNEWRDMLSPVHQENLDNILNSTFLEEVAKHTNEIVKIAAALFMGYVDQATQIAASAGGGGAAAGSLERKKDDDDEMWKYKCFAMACMMVRRPKGQAITRRFHR